MDTVARGDMSVMVLVRLLAAAGYDLKAVKRSTQLKRDERFPVLLQVFSGFPPFRQMAAYGRQQSFEFMAMITNSGPRHYWVSY